MKVNVSATDEVFMVSFVVPGCTYESWIQVFRRSYEAGIHVTQAVGTLHHQRDLLSPQFAGEGQLTQVIFRAQKLSNELSVGTLTSLR